MSADMGLLQRLTGLRERLAQLGTREPNLDQASPHQQLLLLEHRLAQLRAAHRHLEGSGKSANNATASTSSDTAANRFDWRVRRLLLHGRRVLDRLRGLLAAFTTGDWAEGAPGLIFQESLETAQFALRSAEHWPSECQDFLANGLDALLGALEKRLDWLEAMEARRRHRADRLDALVSILRTILQGRVVSLTTLQPLVLELIEEATHGHPLSWFTPNPVRPLQWAAACGMNTAAVLARILPFTADWIGRQAEALTAALLVDLGMAQAPPELLGWERHFTPEQRSVVELHVEAGCAALRAVLPTEEWLLEAINQHHERPNGTGYPAGESAPNLNHLGKLLAVASSYSSLCTARSWRPAGNPQSALAEVLLEGERGDLDKESAAMLEKAIGFYPIGSVVELSDGRMARVIGPASGLALREGRLAERPIVELLSQPLPSLPRFQDLMLNSGWHIVRAFSCDEAKKLVGRDLLDLW